MLNLLQSIFRGSSPSTGPDQDLIRAAIERVVDGTEPRLRAVRRYQKLLHEPVARAVAHVIALVDALPAPVEISRREFTRDAPLRAFFASPDHLQEVVSYSDDLRKYLQTAKPSISECIHCLLTLDRSEKGVLGMALRGDVVSHDVAQRVVTFSDHRLVGFADSAAETTWELKKRAFDHLIHTALQNLTVARDQTQVLERQRRLLKKKSATMADAHWGMTSILQPGAPTTAALDPLETAGATPQTDTPTDDALTIERKLAAIERELAELEIDTATLEGQLAGVAATLNEPASHLRLEQTSLTLDPMGVRLEGSSAQGAAPLELTELVGGERRRVVLPGYVLRVELLPPRDFLQEAKKRLQAGR